VTWQRSRYVAEAQGRRLSLVDGLGLTPGSYRFYYLPRSGVVVGVERLGLSLSSASARDEFLNALAQANRFSVESLMAFRAGRVDEATRGAVLRQRGLTTGLVVFVILAVSAAVLLGASSDPEAWPVLLIVGVLDVIFVGFMVWAFIRVANDLQAGVVLAREGRVQRQVVRSNRSSSYYYRLGDLRFRVSGTAYNALVEGVDYRIYYLPRSKTLVGIEPVSVDARS